MASMPCLDEIGQYIAIICTWLQIPAWPSCSKTNQLRLKSEKPHADVEDGLEHHVERDVASLEDDACLDGRGRDGSRGGRSAGRLLNRSGGKPGRSATQPAQGARRQPLRCVSNSFQREFLRIFGADAKRDGCIREAAGCLRAQVTPGGSGCGEAATTSPMRSVAP